MKNSELKDDGERMIPFFHKGQIIYGEHIGRYMAVADAVKDKTILDIASGSGYGTKLLAEHAKFAYGVDIEEDAIKYSERHYKAKNIEYIVGSGTGIPLQDNTIDCVISMETIEHIEEQDEFLKEIKRVMKPNGFLILSTPNDKVYPKGNHFHVKEHNKESLTKLLSKHFKNVSLSYQVVSIAASIMSEEKILSGDTKADWELYKYYEARPDDSIYYLALCGDQEVPRIKHNTILSQEYSHLQQKEMAEAINDLKARLGAQEAATKEQKSIANELDKRLQHIYNTKMWRIRARAGKAKRAIKR